MFALIIWIKAFMNIQGGTSRHTVEESVGFLKGYGYINNENLKLAPFNAD